MQLVATAEQMQKFDRAAISGLSIPGLVLMENAGRAFVDRLQEKTGTFEGKSVSVVCGKGNNGGDGFVIARHIANRGGAVDVVLLCRPSELKGDAATNFAALRSMAADRHSHLRLIRAVTPGAMKRVKFGGIIVDAVFGTGFSGSPRKVFASAIECINSSGGPVASVDIPSGVNATTGEVETTAVRAALTITMGLPKVGHLVGAGRDHTGELFVVDISIPPFLIRPFKEQVFLVDRGDVRSALPVRPRTAHKYSVGKVLVIGGSKNYTGAPAMAALAALKVGAGAVVLAIPKSIHPVMARKLTEVILLPLAETADGTIAEEAMGELQERMDWADVVALGPGLSRNADTDRLVLGIVARHPKPLVVDADALGSLALKPGILRKRRGISIITPHSGELGRLVHSEPAEIERRRVMAARDASNLFRCIVVLKGSPTVTAAPTGTIFVNPTGNPGMATIGSGDVLTGTIAGLYAQGMTPEQSAWGGVFIHGDAGDIGARQLGERSLLATDILDRLSNSLKEVQSGARIF
jgi:ADP-dependent NAD(P)H-hydrate dehydratase / NAD(P)H-hydrate epimerase